MHKKKNGRRFVLCLIFLMLTGCAKTEEAKWEDIEQEKNILQEYQSFYGTWEYTAVLSEHSRLGGDEGYQSLLGMTVTYMPGYYECGKERIDDPTYLMMIHPMKGNYATYFPYQTGIYSLIPEAEYYVCIQIVNKPSCYYDYYAGEEFVVKDEDTLLAFDHNCIYELKRKGYIEDAVSVTESNPPESRMSYEQNDAYKLFYGSWEYTDIIYEDGSEGDSFIGKTVTYMPDYFTFETERLEKPIYRMTVLPLGGENSEELLEQLPTKKTLPIEELMPEADIFVYVEVYGEAGHSTIESAQANAAGRRFVIVDDNTILCFEQGSVFKLTRQSYIEGYGEYPYDGCYQDRW
ncbi:MAG: hypothetical protein ACI4SE_07950 [Lachnospiraceae bacterium]